MIYVEVWVVYVGVVKYCEVVFLLEKSYSKM